MSWRKKWWLAFVAVVLVAGVAIVAARYRTAAATPASVPFSDLLQHVAAGQVAAVVVESNRLAVTLHDGRRLATVPPPNYVAANPAFVSDLAARRIRVEVADAAASQGGGYIALLIGGVFLVAMGLVLYRVTTGRIPSLETRPNFASPDLPQVTFADVAGVDEAKDEVREIVDFLKEPARFGTLGGRIPKGVLLIGPPGTGKTLLARSMAGEAGVPFIFASGSDFVEMYAGVGASRVRKLFKEARRHPSCIIFIDELDAVGRSRGSNSLSHEEREQTLNQLLVEMDGFTSSQGTIVVAATNRQDILDQALLRPGRFDRQVVVGNPDLKGREQILKVHAGKATLADDVDLRSIARGTPGFSGADLANLVNEAALMAARAGREAVHAADLEEARDKVMMGVERRSVTMSERERVNCAYHESGHAIVAALLPEADPLHKVTIIPRGRALGVTMQLPEVDRYTHTKSYIETQIAVLMGGRVAEELFLRHMTSGASNDIERATELARKMVCELGMSSLGPLAFRRRGGAFDDDPAAGFSEATARRVDEEIREVVMRGYETARQLLEKQRSAVEALTAALLEHESVDSTEIRDLLGRTLVPASTGGDTSGLTVVACSL